VTIPRAERYAVHKLMVAVERQDQAKSAKDILQAGILIEALAVRRPLELASAWQAAWKSGTRWRAKLEAGRERLPTLARETLSTTTQRTGRKKKR
jgi:hypothetical protein